MKKGYKPEQIVRLLQDVQMQISSGASLREVAKQLGVNPGTLCRWQSKFGGMDVNEARRLRALEDENRRLKHVVADQAVQISILKEVNSKKW